MTVHPLDEAARRSSFNARAAHMAGLARAAAIGAAARSRELRAQADAIGARGRKLTAPRPAKGRR
jgi:hypothetical protein